MAWALVYTTSTVHHATIVEGYLQSHGIPARILSAADSSRALTVGSLAVVKVFVPAGQAVRAEGLIRDMDRSTDEADGTDQEG
ncbi:MAG: putative signal transducing protein [Candidatus Kapaibacterium sp.]